MTTAIDVSTPIRTLVLDEDEGGATGALTVAAVEGDQSLGLAAAERDATGTFGLHAVLVSAAARRRGVATALVRAVTAEAARRGATELFATLKDDQPGADVVEHILARAGWQEPLPGMVLCRARATEMRKAPFMAAPVPAGVELFTWDTLSEEDRRDLEAREAEVPEAFRATRQGDPLPALSVGARIDGRVVAWMLLSRVDADAVQYGRLYVQDDLRRTHLGAAVLAAAIHAQYDAGITFGDFAVRVDNAPMLGFLDRHLAPYLESRTTVRRRVAPAIG